MMRRLVLVLSTAGLLGLVGCEAPAPEPAAPAPDTSAAAAPAPAPEPERLEGVDDLLGEWIVTEKPGTAPDEGPSVVTFTPTGGYLVRNDAGTVTRATFRPVGVNRIAVTDSAGTREFEYVREEQTLTLTTPGTESTTVMERRG